MDSMTPHTVPAHDNLPEPPTRTAGLPHARSAVTRLIHLLLLVLVLHQLIGSEFMRFPLPGDPPGWAFSLHEYLGLVSLSVVTAFWGWAVLRHGETRLSRLVPWFSGARFRDVVDDLEAQIRRLIHGRVPSDEGGALASAIHGLGLLAVAAMAITGTVFFVTQGTGVGRAAMSVHKLIANLVWAYLIAHAGVAILHHVLGSDIFSRMFWNGRRQR